MAIDVRLLFELKGKAGPELQRVEEAMEWLLSPEAEGIGEKLLRDAHKLHGKPITIEVVEETTAYVLSSHHRLAINPKEIERTLVTDGRGQTQPMSLERTLAHELKHAGQIETAIESHKELEKIQSRAANRVNENMSEELQNAQEEYLGGMMAAEDYDTAIKYAEQQVDEIDIPIGAKKLKTMKQDPEFLRYIETIEQPAMDVENQVAQLRGEPVREDYIDSITTGDEILRNSAIQKYIRLFNLDRLPGAPESAKDIQSWTASLTKRGDRQIT